jgi:integrase
VRDVPRIPTGRRKASRSQTPAECRDWLAQLDADDAAREKDLPDLCRFMLDTGVRVGEALAVDWSDVDLVAATVTVEHTLIQLTGVGLVRKSPKSEAGETRKRGSRRTRSTPPARRRAPSPIARPRAGVDDPELLLRATDREPGSRRCPRRVARGERKPWVSHGWQRAAPLRSTL